MDGTWARDIFSLYSCPIATMVSYEETGFGVTLFLGGIGSHLLTRHCKFHASNVNGWWSMCLKQESMVGKLTL
jgi:hypothetical protein